MEEIITQINDELEYFIKEAGIKKEETFELGDKLADLIIKNYKAPTPRQMYTSIKKLKHFDLKESIKLATDFIKEYYDKEYLDKFLDAIDNNTIFYRGDEKEASCYIPNEDKIYINLLDNINDPLTIVHEFMHYMNSHSENYSDACNYFSEAISFYNELLFEEFIKNKYKKYLKDLEFNAYDRKTVMYIKAIELKFMTNLLKLKLEGREINEYFIGEALESMSYIDEKYLSAACADFSLTIDEGFFEDIECIFIHLNQYVVAGIFSKYLYFLHKKDDRLCRNLNKIIEKFGVEDLYNFLELRTNQVIYEDEEIHEDDYVPIVFDKKSQKKLELIYKRV